MRWRLPSSAPDSTGGTDVAASSPSSSSSLPQWQVGRCTQARWGTSAAACPSRREICKAEVGNNGGGLHPGGGRYARCRWGTAAAGFVLGRRRRWHRNSEIGSRGLGIWDAMGTKPATCDTEMNRYGICMYYAIWWEGKTV
jgi:hypothetical protein